MVFPNRKVYSHTKKKLLMILENDAIIIRHIGFGTSGGLVILETPP